MNVILTCHVKYALCRFWVGGKKPPQNRKENLLQHDFINCITIKHQLSCSSSASKALGKGCVPFR